MSSVSNGLYFLTLPLVSVMRVIYRKIRHARYLYIKRNVEKVWGARYTLGARYLSKNTVFALHPAPESEPAPVLPVYVQAPTLSRSVTKKKTTSDAS